MRWKRKSLSFRQEERKAWHSFFAWKPVYIESISAYVWLEFIERRETFAGLMAWATMGVDRSVMEYRLPLSAVESALEDAEQQQCADDTP
jgi:hypothetical protein